MRIIYARQAEVARWLFKRLPDLRHMRDYSTLGVEHDGEIVAAAMFHDWRPDAFGGGGGIEISAASATPRAAVRGIMRDVLQWPFRQMGCRYVMARAMASNTRSLRLMRGLGFRQFGVHPGYYAPGADAVLFILEKK